MEHLALISLPNSLFCDYVVMVGNFKRINYHLLITALKDRQVFCYFLYPSAASFQTYCSPASKPSSLLCYCSALSMISGWPCCTQCSSEQKGLQLHFSLCTLCAALKESANPNHNSATFYVQFPIILFLAFTGANNDVN